MHLILNSYGTSLRKENNQFVIQTEEGKQFFPVDKVKSISLSKGARISSDAVLLAIENEVDLFFTDSEGMPKGRVWSNQYGSISTIRKNQLDFVFSKQAVAWIVDVLATKLENQVSVLLTLDAPDQAGERKIQSVINTIEDHKLKIRNVEGDYVSDIAPTLRGWEGAATRRYFEAINLCLPPDYKFEGRSRMPAADKFNALLNYGYGMLYGKVEGALIRAGLDPYVGIMHRDNYNRPVLVYDFIERYRMWTDYVVIQLCTSDAFIDECFEEKQGGMWLQGLGKRILIQSVNDYLAEVILRNNKQKSRSSHIQDDAWALASSLKTYAP